ncbi:MAG: hypothetical protein M3P41_01235 [Actinomycetota bacterium]|jgi:hypothetical protein|nr:hypothetical protein [Actinomycetota bacterium]
MAGDPIFEERKPGLLARLFGGLSRRTLDVGVRRSEYLNLSVPAERSEAVRAAVERWLTGHGVTTPVTAEETEHGKARIRAKLGEEDAAKLDFRTDAMQAELQDVLADALG